MNSFYLLHYFDFKNAGPFFVVSFLCLAGVLAVILVAARVQTGYHGRKDAANMDTRTLKAVRKTHFSLIESFYEMVFSSTAVLLFLSVYYELDAYWSPLSEYWYKYRDILLLVFILLSVLVTSWLDVALVRLTHIKSEQKACIRLLSSFYIILILLYIKVIYQDDNYDTLIQYFLLLAAGRFLYFDFTWDWFKETIAGLWRNLPLLGLMAVYSAIVCWYGFKVDFLLKSNGVIVSTLIAHLFMDLCIFVMHKTRLLRFFIPSDADRDSALRDAQAAYDRRNYAQRMADADGRNYAARADSADRRNYAQRMADADGRNYAARSGAGERPAAGGYDNYGYYGHQGEVHLNYAQRMGLNQGRQNADVPDFGGRYAKPDDRETNRAGEACPEVKDVESHEGTHIIRNPEELKPSGDEIHVPEYKLDETERNVLAHDARMGNSRHLNYYQRRKEEE